MGRKKKDSKSKKEKDDKVKDKSIKEKKSLKKKEEKVEIIEKREAFRGKRWGRDDIQFDELSLRSLERPLRDITPSLEMSENVTSQDPLEVELQDVSSTTTSSNEDNNPNYDNFKPGDYSPKDTYQSKGSEDAYDGGGPGMIASTSETSNFSTSNFGAATTNEDSVMGQQKHYEPDMDKAKRDRNRTI
ncbi:hypothetical protein GOV12_00875 [Candidatus Pacearchaeota archaeon]|nr:hypothetical protein [Candidatus Pacearchaeota archaeon]